MYAKICKSFNQKMLDEFNKKIGRKTRGKGRGIL